MMQKLGLVLGILATGLVVPLTKIPTASVRYTVPAEVCEVSNQGICFLDESGNEWVATGYHVSVGQTVTLVMSDNGTPNRIYDDTVIGWNPKRTQKIASIRKFCGKYSSLVMSRSSVRIGSVAPESPHGYVNFA